MPRNILLLNGHPAEQSLSNALIDAYEHTARAAGHQLRRHDLHAMEFDPDFGGPAYANVKPLEPSLQRFMEDLEWSNHVVIATPMWWGGLPARLKGMFDRALLPGNSFDPRITRMGLPKPLMTGRSARVMLTSDTPGWALRLLYGNAIRLQLSRQILGFVGIRPTRYSLFGPVKGAAQARVSRWIDEAARMGAQGR